MIHMNTTDDKQCFGLIERYIKRGPIIFKPIIPSKLPFYEITDGENTFATLSRFSPGKYECYYSKEEE